MQILLDRGRLVPIPYEKLNVAEVEDIPMRKAFRKPDDPAPSQIERNWQPVSLNPKDWNPTKYAVDSDYDAAEAEWMIEHKKSKEAQDLQRELDIFDDYCTMLESQRVTCICSFASVPP